MMYELQLADEHTLVSFLRKRITCKCLDTKYKQVKSLPNMGRCCNDGCSLPEGHVQRSKMFCSCSCSIVLVVMRLAIALMNVKRMIGKNINSAVRNIEG